MTGMLTCRLMSMKNASNVFHGRNNLEKTLTRTHVTTKGLTHQEPRFISVSNEQKLDLADLLSL